MAHSASWVERTSNKPETWRNVLNPTILGFSSPRKGHKTLLNNSKLQRGVGIHWLFVLIRTLVFLMSGYENVEWLCAVRNRSGHTGSHFGDDFVFIPRPNPIVP